MGKPNEDPSDPSDPNPLDGLIGSGEGKLNAGAIHLHEQFTSFVNAGFSRREAIILTNTLLQQGMSKTVILNSHHRP